MNDNKSAAELKASFTVVKQDSHFTKSSVPLQPSTPEHELADVLNTLPLLISQQVVFFIGQGFNLDCKGDRFGQHLD